MYKIQLPNFEGPFDLLLYFIKRDELNIYDIPISNITNEFLQYVKIMKILDLELAGEFIVMASTLMYIKGKMLLPQEVDENGEVIEDPRRELVQQLLEYKQIKEASWELSEMEENNRYNYYRNKFEIEQKEANENESYKNATLFDLLNAFQKTLEAKKSDLIRHNVEMFTYSIEELSEFVMKELTIKSRLKFSDIIKVNDKLHIVVTFLSLLNLMKSEKILINQDDTFSEIIITKRPNLN